MLQVCKFSGAVAAVEVTLNWLTFAESEVAPTVVGRAATSEHFVIHRKDRITSTSMEYRTVKGERRMVN